MEGYASLKKSLTSSRPMPSSPNSCEARKHKHKALDRRLLLLLQEGTTTERDHETGVVRRRNLTTDGTHSLQRKSTTKTGSMVRERSLVVIMMSQIDREESIRSEICGRKERARIFFFFWNGQEDLELAVRFLAFFLLQVMWYTHTYSKMEILPFFV
jgi:hypothetical protein